MCENLRTGTFGGFNAGAGGDENGVAALRARPPRFCTDVPDAELLVRIEHHLDLIACVHQVRAGGAVTGTAHRCRQFTVERAHFILE
jgi:hypothetical protein